MIIVIAFIIGAFFGAVCIACVISASEYDRAQEEMRRREEENERSERKA